MDRILIPMVASGGYVQKTGWGTQALSDRGSVPPAVRVGIVLKLQLLVSLHLSFFSVSGAAREFALEQKEDKQIALYNYCSPARGVLIWVALFHQLAC